MAKLKQGGADVKPAAELYKRWRSAEKNVDDLLTTFNVTEDEESWADAGLEPYEEDEIRNAIAMRDSAGADYDSYLSSRGVKITDPMQQAGRQSAPTGAPAHAGLADAIPEENRGQRTNRAIARGTAAPQAAPQTGQKGPFSNYLEARNYYKKKYPTASGQYIDNFIARKFGFRKGR